MAQTVTTPVKDIHRNIYTRFQFNPFSGSWEEVSWKSTNQNFQSHMVAMFFDESAQKTSLPSLVLNYIKDCQSILEEVVSADWTKNNNKMAKLSI